MAKKAQVGAKSIESFKHDEASRKNIPTAEYEALVQEREKTPIRVAYERRNRDLDPQLVWRGKDAQDESHLVVSAAPLYIQEKVHPKALIDDLLRGTREREHAAGQIMPDLFSDFNGIPKGVDKTEFYQHDQNWSNRMILGDSLQVMASLAEREGLRGKVQCIYIDPPYGIKFNSNFQWSTTSRDVKDGDRAQITREPEQVKAFRDTWRDGIHSYLAYLRDRFTVARDLLAESGSIFVQIGDQNAHHIRELLDEVFGPENFALAIAFKKKGNQKGNNVESISDNILWYFRSKRVAKVRALYKLTSDTEELERDYKFVRWNFADYRLEDFAAAQGLPEGTSAAYIVENIPDAALYMSDNLTVGGFRSNQSQLYTFRGKERDPGLKRNRSWMHTSRPVGGDKYCGLDRLAFADRIIETSSGSIRKKVFAFEAATTKLANLWTDTGGASDPRYIVETSTEVVKRCVLMASDPGDLVLDPTCGAGTTAFVAEEWGRRWITIDTSRVALALARARLMGARYPFYILADSRQGQLREAEILGGIPSEKPATENLRAGFVYERVPRVTSTVVANDSEIDVVWEKWQVLMEQLRSSLNKALGKKWEEWEIPRDADSAWVSAARDAHAKFWEARIERQKEIDRSIAAKAEFEYLYDRPCKSEKTVRVAGPFTVESLDPHRILGVDENDDLIDPLEKKPGNQDADQRFVATILESLKMAGVQQAHKEDRIEFSALTAWQGDRIVADGRYNEGVGKDEKQRRAAIFIGPEFGTVTRPDLVEAAREAAESGFDVLIACAFSYEAYATEFEQLGSLRVLKARMNADLHMAADLKNTGKGNLFVIFGEPDIDVLVEGSDIRVKINGVDVFHPATGEVRSDGPDGIACWFIDTDYNAESFFVRHAYFLGANDPYGSLKTTLKAEIDEEAWASLHSDISRPFPKPKSGRIAVKVINHLGDEVMEVFKVAS